MIELDKKIAIVTGGAQGIGAAFVRGLVKHGAKVMIADLAAADELIKELGADKATSCICDITDDAMLAAMVAQTKETFGLPTILVNNAAYFSQAETKMFAELTNEDWDRNLTINVRGLWQTSKAVVPDMAKAGGGSIVNIGSGSTFTCPPGQIAYISAKGAVQAMTRAMARELGAQNIRVNVITPSLTKSENVAKSPNWSQFLDKAKAGRVLSRDMLPDDLVGTMLHLASDNSGFVTGQTFNVDGGLYFY